MLCACTFSCLVVAFEIASRVLTEARHWNTDLDNSLGERNALKQIEEPASPPADTEFSLSIPVGRYSFLLLSLCFGERAGEHWERGSKEREYAPLQLVRLEGHRVGDV